MAESFGDKFTIVEVMEDDGQKQFWAALAKPNQALTLVLSEVPEGWTAKLADRQQLSAKQSEVMRGLHLQPGEIYRLTGPAKE
jgi:hypothetical protein